MVSKEVDINVIFPLVPLKGVVVFPSGTIHLDVGRPKSIRALEKAMEEMQLIFLTSQVDVAIADPAASDIYSIGTVATIKQLVKLPNGGVRAFIEGKFRARIKQVVEEDGFLAANVDKIEEVSVYDPETDALLRILKESTADYRSVFPKMPADDIDKILTLTDPLVIVYQLAGILPIPFQTQQTILELPELKDRMKELTKVIHYEKEISELKGQIDQEVRRAIDEHQKEFFLREQLKVVQQELNKNDGQDGENELADKIEKSGMPEKVLSKAKKELARYEQIPSASPESNVLRNYLQWLIDLPWAKSSKSAISLDRVGTVLDQDHYGLEKVKERIIEYVAVQKISKSLKAPIICLVGPPGVGKTSLAKSIATAIKREFVRISLGGVRDEAEIRGHRRTYIGAMPGRIIQGIKKAGTNNPVFLLDEIDKMASDFRGDPASAMLEVLDPEQNHTFSDHYIEEAFDLSKVMFIATANGLSAIPHALRDRMEIIELSSYTELEKWHIAKNHLLAKQLKTHGLSKYKIDFQDDALRDIIRYYTREAGVRDLERQIGTVCRKITRKLASKEQKEFVVTALVLPDYLGKQKFDYHQSFADDLVGVATGLAFTSVGGDTLQIEVVLAKGKGKLVLTGKLGEVMKESAMAALSYVRAHAVDLGIDEDFYENSDVHIHVPEGAVPKDGPSAGITMTTALVSALTNRPVKSEVGMTGEMTLRGRVLPIGGLKEKAISAHRSGLKVVVCPEKNKKDMDDVPEIVRHEIEFVFVERIEEVLEKALQKSVVKI